MLIRPCVWRLRTIWTTRSVTCPFIPCFAPLFSIYLGTVMSGKRFLCWFMTRSGVIMRMQNRVLLFLWTCCWYILVKYTLLIWLTWTQGFYFLFFFFFAGCKFLFFLLFWLRVVATRSVYHVLFPVIVVLPWDKNILTVLLKQCRPVL